MVAAQRQRRRWRGSKSLWEMVVAGGKAGNSWRFSVSLGLRSLPEGKFRLLVSSCITAQFTLGLANDAHIQSCSCQIEFSKVSQ